MVLLHITDDKQDCGTWHTLAQVKSAPGTPAHALAYAGEALEKAGLSVTYEIATPGERGIHTGILECAERQGADLILIGGKGRGFLQDMLIGRVSKKILEESRVHVLVTHFRDTPGPEDEVPSSPRHRESTLFSRILVPVDFSRPTYETIDFVSEMGGYDELILLHVIATVDDRHDLQKKLKHSLQILSSLQRDLSSGSGKISPLIRFGDPAEEICSMADEERATLILISRYGASDYTRNTPIGSIAAEVAKRARIPVLVRYPESPLDVEVRVLTSDELSRAEEVWSHYRQQRPDPSADRIFGVFVEGEMVSVARCRRYTDGLEVDGIFTMDEFRGRGYARKAVLLLVSECGDRPLYTYSTREMIDFFRSYGFLAIPEREVPLTIRERYSFAMGDPGGANLYPMKRGPEGRE